MGDSRNDRAAPFVLIVDDVEANRFVLRDIISEMECRPILAENGVQALKIMKNHRPQMVILDIAMPEMDGFELCKLMKEDAELKEIPIIFISAFDDPSDIVKGFSLGGEDYITKPFIPEVVKARIRLHLRFYDASRDLIELNRQLHISVNEQLRQIEIERKNVLYALIRVARENACYDEDHMERLSYNCRVLTEAMQLSPIYGHLISDNYVDTIELAAPLCDLGNVAIPTHILQKADTLDPEENRIMRTHTTIGAKILKDIRNMGDYNDFMQISIDIADYHHENWDGTGYPYGIKGEDIPLSAQILSIVSAYCALTENRIYRDSYSREDAFEIMQEDAGKKFNPDILLILRKIFRQLH